MLTVPPLTATVTPSCCTGLTCMMFVHSNLCPCAMPHMLTSSPFDNSNWSELNSKLGYASLMTSVHYFSHILQPRNRRNSAVPCHNRPHGVTAHFKSMLLLACMTKSAQGALVWPIELQAYQAQSWLCELKHLCMRRYAQHATVNTPVWCSTRWSCT